MSSLPIRIVLIETSHPGNIGAVARAMKNMALEQLYLVRPRRFPDPEATARASGADDLLERAVVCDSLEEALTGCHKVYGASARLRTLSWPQVDARQCATQALEQSSRGEVALLFGREATGLTNEELQRCNYLAHIPSNPDYSSLNIAAAVQVFAYELMVARDDVAKIPTGIGDEEPPATAEDIERFYQHLEQVLVEIDFLDPDNPRQLMRRLRRLYNRAALEKTELNILRGILTETQKRLRELS